MTSNYTGRCSRRLIRSFLCFADVALAREKLIGRRRRCGANSCSPPADSLNRTMNDLMPLHGMRVRLERGRDMTDNYCTALTVIRVEEGASRAELRCATCGRHRAWLPMETTKGLLILLKYFPAAKQEVVIIRDKDYENPEPDKLHLA